MFRFLISILFLIPLFPLSQANIQVEIGALKKAEGIANSSSRITRELKELRKQASLIQDPALRSAVTEFLVQPHFQLSRRRNEQASIRDQLIHAGLLDPKDEPAELIPNHDPMPFNTAPASFWIQHHTYPGGLACHTLTNLRSALALGENWQFINEIELRMDYLRAAPIWHDIAKTWTLVWQADGSVSKSEGKIAGTGAHHILGVSEAILRGFPADFIVTLAAAHAPAHPTAGLDELIRFLKAASIIAGKSSASAGLTEDASKLAHAAPLESYLHHLSDHDWVASEVSMKEASAALSEMGRSNWEQDELFATFGDLKITQTWRNSGQKGLKQLFVQKSL